MIIKLLKGFLMGLLANAIGTYLYVWLFIQEPFEETLHTAYYNGFLGSLIGLGAVLNFGLFFFLLTSRIGRYRKPIQVYEAKGVLMATIIAALAVAYFEFGL